MGFVRLRDPMDKFKRSLLNYKVKLTIWYSARPQNVKICCLVLIVLYVFYSRVNVIVKEGGDEKSMRIAKVKRLQTLFNPSSPILLDLTGIREPYPDNLTQYKEKLFKENQFNTWVCDHTPLNRRQPDHRTDKCIARANTYIPVTKMPTCSIVFIFYNECLSVLLRSIISIINTIPSEVLVDIILVDDASEKLEMKERLDEEIAVFEGIVKLVRQPERKGLMVARTTGAEHATGDVVVFLDSHIEATEGWSEPLLDRIGQNRKTVIQPNIPDINYNTFILDSYVDQSSGAHAYMGGFSWDMVFQWKELPDRETRRRKGDNSVEVRSPTMAGGLFAMDREYFFELGAYDLGMDIWGCENLELSFRVWMCGGVLEINTCSTIAHVYRKTFPYTSKPNIGSKNGRRLAEVWLDESKEFFYQVSPKAKYVEMGDISDRIDLRKRLRCNSFRWYLDNVYPEMDIPSRDYSAHGEIRNMGNKNRCVDNMSGWIPPQRVGMYDCHGDGSSQYWQLDKRTNELKQTQHATTCLDAVTHENIQLGYCHGGGGNQEWRLTKTGELKNNGLCLSHDNQHINLERCDGSPKQRWQWSHVNHNII